MKKKQIEAGHTRGRGRGCSVERRLETWVEGPGAVVSNHSSRGKKREKRFSRHQEHNSSTNGIFAIKGLWLYIKGFKWGYMFKYTQAPESSFQLN